VSVVIPALNEAASLPSVIARLPSSVEEVVLVDGGSTDGTRAVACQLREGLRVVQQRGRGKGDALACGFTAAHGDIIVTLDADGSMDPVEIPRFIEALRSGAEVAKGSRFLAGGGSSDLTFIRRIGNRLLATLFNLLYGTAYTDLCYGYTAFWARCLPQIYPTCNGFEVEAFINGRAVRQALRVTEVPSFERRRLHGNSKLHPLRDGGRVLATMVLERLRSANGAPR